MYIAGVLSVLYGHFCPTKSHKGASEKQYNSFCLKAVLARKDKLNLNVGISQGVISFIDHIFQPVLRMLVTQVRMFCGH